MPSERNIIEATKSYLRRKYRDDADGLIAIKALADALYSDDPADVELTNTAFEGGSVGGQISNKREIRRIALEELIAERDPDYVPPAPIPRREIAARGQLGFGPIAPWPWGSPPGEIP